MNVYPNFNKHLTSSVFGEYEILSFTSGSALQNSLTLFSLCTTVVFNSRADNVMVADVPLPAADAIIIWRFCVLNDSGARKAVYVIVINVDLDIADA